MKLRFCRELHKDRACIAGTEAREIAITSHHPAPRGAWPPPPAAAAGQPRRQRFLPPARTSQELSLEGGSGSRAEPEETQATIQ